MTCAVWLGALAATRCEKLRAPSLGDFSELKTPYRESLPRERSECCGHGTTHVIFEPLDFIARLAALVPPPRVNLTRYHGVLAPNRYHLPDARAPPQGEIFDEGKSIYTCRDVVGKAGQGLRSA